jgi:hypothetical protein
MTDLQQQIEVVRQEAFTAGYATAMNEVKELTARAARDAGEAAVPSRNGRGRGRGRTVTRQAAPTSAPVRRRSPRANGLASHTERAGRSARRRPQRGTNAVLVSEVLKSLAPNALRQAEIRRALEANGTMLSFPSIRYALEQLAARNAARQVGHSKTWRHAG